MAAPKLSMSNCKTLLVRLPNPVGDVVMTTPLLQVLRRELPETEIVVAGHAAYADLLDGVGTFDRYLAFPTAPARAASVGQAVQKKPGIRAQAQWLRQANADVILLLPNSWSSALVARLAGIRTRIGRRAHGRSLLLSHKLPPVGPARAMTAIYLEMLAPLGIEVPTGDSAPLAKLVAPDEAGESKYIGVAPGAAFGPSKIYPLDLLSQTVAEVQAHTNLPALLMGSPAETDLLHLAATEMQQRKVTVQIAEPGGFADAKSNIQSCDVLLTMDSGARHIAAALGVPQVVLYGPTHPGWSAHSLENTTILRRDDVDCLACHHKTCPIDHRCMRWLQPSTVAAAVIQILNRGSSHAAQR
jgi:heptosyltransferase-2